MVSNIAKKLIQKTAQKMLAKDNYIDYLKYAHHIRYKETEHNKLIAETLEKVETGKINRLMVFLPPRLGKSMSISESFPSWFIGKNKQSRVIGSSYGNNLAKKFGNRNKEKVEEFGKDLFDIEIRSDKKAKTNWEIKEHKGGMIAAGIGGGITGEGADLLIIDDPIKNRAEANSKTYRDRIWDEWESTLLTRLHPGGKIILVMTRWHEDDLAGRLLEKEGKVEEGGKWHVLRIPAEAEEGEEDPLGREPGEPICPELGFNKEWLEDRKASVGSTTWASLFQQRPRPKEGKIFKEKYFNYYRVIDDKVIELIDPVGENTRILKEKCTFFQTIDTALKKNEENDYTVITTFCLTPNNRLLVWNIFRDKLEVPEQYPAIKKQFERYQPQFQGLEDKSSGTGLIQRGRNDGKPFKVLPADNDKVTRAFDIAVMYENSMVYHPLEASWLDGLEEELLNFPKGKHDDQVDTMSYAGILLRGRSPESNEEDAMSLLQGMKVYS